MSPLRSDRLRIRVDPVACDAFGFCAELLPERITLDEWGYPIIDGTPVDSELVELATRAAAECPRRAIVLEQVQQARRTGKATDRLPSDQGVHPIGA